MDHIWDLPSTLQLTVLGVLRNMCYNLGDMIVHAYLRIRTFLSTSIILGITVLRNILERHVKRGKEVFLLDLTGS